MARLKPEEGGEEIGPYKLREQIGEGGFGTVWVADQEVPVRRRVALKIIKLGTHRPRPARHLLLVIRTVLVLRALRARRG